VLRWPQCKSGTHDRSLVNAVECLYTWTC
jgi:hypothetical protein